MQIRHLLFGTLLSLPAFLSAQEFYRPEPEVQKNELSIGLSIISPINVSYQSAGFVPAYLGLSGLPVDGSTDDVDAAAYYYLTGSVSVDNAYYYTVTDDNDTPDDTTDDTSTTYFGGNDYAAAEGVTSNFTLYSMDQVGYFQDGQFVSDPTLAGSTGQYYVRQSTYAGTASNAQTYEDDGSYKAGLDINYTRYFDNACRFGITAGITVHGTHSSGSERQDATIAQTDYFYEADLDNPIEADEEDNPYGSYTGTYYRPDADDEDGRNLISFLPDSDLTTQYTSYGQVQSDWDAEIGFYDLRLGALYRFNLTRKWSMKVGAGISFMFVDCDMTLFNVLYPEGIPEDSDYAFMDGQRYDYSKGKSEFILGGYANADFVYEINRRVSWSTGAIYHSGDEVEQNFTTTYGDSEVSLGSLSIDAGNYYGIRSAVNFKF
ncbi:MAG: hypothetical protein JW739_02750 [Opitutales bacterium]|nr:hypothetical protein [Opitutales bacterium]